MYVLLHFAACVTLKKNGFPYHKWNLIWLIVISTSLLCAISREQLHCDFTARRVSPPCYRMRLMEWDLCKCMGNYLFFKSDLLWRSDLLVQRNRPMLFHRWFARLSRCRVIRGYSWHFRKHLKRQVYAFFILSFDDPQFSSILTYVILDNFNMLVRHNWQLNSWINATFFSIIVRDPLLDFYICII